MDWIKRNLTLVISGAVTLVALGGAGYYLYTKISDDRVAGDLLTTAQATYQDYLNKPAFPAKENVDLVKEEQVKLRDFLSKAVQYFPTNIPPAAELTNNFGAHLFRSIAELHGTARAASVTLPTNNFAFGFQSQRELLQYEQASLPLLISQLNDIKNLCGILFQARIFELVSIQRAPVTTNDQASLSGATPASIPEFVPPPKRQISTNISPAAMVSPYEVVFKCSSEQLASVLEGIARSRNGFLVRWMKVSAIEGEGGEESTYAEAAPMMNQMINRYRMSPEMMRRYGLGPRGMRPPPMAAPVAEPAAQGTQSTSKKTGVVLEDKPFRVSLNINAIKFIDGSNLAKAAEPDPNAATQPQ